MVKPIRIGARLRDAVRRSNAKIKKRAAGKKIKKFAGNVGVRTLKSTRNTISKTRKSAMKSGKTIRHRSRSKGKGKK